MQNMRGKIVKIIHNFERQNKQPNEQVASEKDIVTEGQVY